MTTLLYRTSEGPVVEISGAFFRIADAWDDLFGHDDLEAHLRDLARAAMTCDRPQKLLSPCLTQEVWAAGVTYFRSRTARMEESQNAGGGDFYDRVYAAERPELFFKATPARVIPPGGVMRLRKDSRWMVPEPELTLVVNRHNRIVGYTVGNDLSCRDIEGENPLYLPQAKVFDGCAALGPAILVSNQPLPKSTAITLDIERDGVSVAGGNTSLASLARDPASLVEFLTREMSFATGCFLMTGTGIVPPDEFTLKVGDTIRIRIEGIGELVNTVA